MIQSEISDQCRIERHDDAEDGVLRLDVLGSPQVRLGGRPIVFRTRKTLVLMTYLALQGGQHPREELIDLFWPEADIEDGRASLRTTLSYLRQGLGEDAESILLTTRGSIGVQLTAPIDLDVQQTAETLRLLRRSPGAPASDSGVFEWLEDVMALYRGEFLSGVTIPDAPDLDAWMEGQRTHWRGVEEEILDRVATMQVEAGDRGAALGTLERWTWVNPDEEMAWYRLIDLYVQFLDQAGARRAWRRYCDVMADLDVEPSEDVTSLATRIDEIQVCRPAPVGAVEIGRNEPEVQNIPFVGRSREQSLLLSAFERSRGGQTEVIIVTGEEGIGKTRLVSQLLRTAEERGADIVTGQALETIDELPYAMLTDALRTRMDAENAPDDLLGDHWLAELARLMPELRERYPDLPPATDDPYLARGRLLEAVARFGQALAERKPLVIFLDDVQWSDVVTLDAVRYAVHRWARHGSPVLLVLAARDVGGQDEPLARWINGMKRDVPVLHLGIGVLQPQIVVQGPRNPAFSRETISSSPPVVPPSAARDHVLSGPF